MKIIAAFALYLLAAGLGLVTLANGGFTFDLPWMQSLVIESADPDFWKGLHYTPFLMAIFACFALTLWMKSPAAHGLAEMTARVFLAATYLVSAIHKVKEPYEFARLIKHYEFLPCTMVDLFALIAPWFWILISILLITGPKTRINTALYIMVMFSFIIALGQATLRNLPITCGCFDIQGVEPSTGAAIIRDLVFLVPAVWLLFKGKNVWLWQLFLPAKNKAPAQAA